MGVCLVLLVCGGGTHAPQLKCASRATIYHVRLFPHTLPSSQPGRPSAHHTTAALSTHTNTYTQTQPQGSFSGVGFAIPIDTVKGIVEQIITHGRVRRPSLGITIAPTQVRLWRFCASFGVGVGGAGLRQFSPTAWLTPHAGGRKGVPPQVVSQLSSACRLAQHWHAMHLTDCCNLLASFALEKQRRCWSSWV